MRLTQIVEALLFASDAPLTAADLSRVDERLDEDTVVAVIDELRAEYDRNERSFTVSEVAGGYQLLTRPEFDVVLDRYQTVPQSAKLSMPALEVLSIVAYRQPIGRAEIEEIRGVQSAAVLRTLQDREIVEPVARGEGLGRPLLYGTTNRFLEHFGFRSLEDLPRSDELPVVLRQTSADGAVPFGVADDPTEPTPLSGAAEAEAEDLHLHVRSARDIVDPEATGEEAVQTAAAVVVASLEGDGSEGGSDQPDGSEESEAGDEAGTETIVRE
jgi:segregation and condensation protein B